jgi:hypothetical protein
MKKYCIAAVVMFSFGLVVSAENKSAQAGARERLIGTWRLVSRWGSPSGWLYPAFS